MELPFVIPTPDRKKIQGTLRPAPEKSEQAIIFVHGLTGHSSEHIFYNAARFFPAHGMDAIRFDLYPGGIEGRLLPECSITTHAADLNLVLEYFRPKYKKLFLVGHSLGAVTVLSSKMQLCDGILLWAPGASEILFDSKMPIVKLLKGTELYKTCWAVEGVIGKEMAVQMLHFPPSRAAAKTLCRPTFVACGAEDVFLEASRSYYEHCPCNPKGLKIIERAGHQFNEGDTALELYEASWEFLKGL
jgi:pimeloyl-ACP methyl ester carboxylesterase